MTLCPACAVCAGHYILAGHAQGRHGEETPTQHSLQTIIFQCYIPDASEVDLPGCTRLHLSNMENRQNKRDRRVLENQNSYQSALLLGYGRLVETILSLTEKVYTS